MAFVLLGGWLVVASLRAHAQQAGVQEWPTAVGRIRPGRVERVRFMNRRQETWHYRVFLPYSFRVGGREYAGSNWQFVGPPPFEGHREFADEEAARALLRAHPVGSEVVVHFDPDDPRRNVVDPRSSSGLPWQFWGGLLASAAGLGLLAAFVRSSRRAAH